MSSPDVSAVPRPAPRPCAGCDVVDTDPRHVTAARPGEVAPPVWHHRCHAGVGCPQCVGLLDAAGGATGDALLAFQVATLTPDPIFEGAVTDG
jgi:hypothetical protein